MSKEIIYRSCGNVFADLGLPDADEYFAKSKLAVEIFKIIKSRRLTQAAAGKLLGIPQPKVSALLRGQLEGFSTDRYFVSSMPWDAMCKLPFRRPIRARRDKSA